VAEILSILDEIPLGSKRIEVGMMLREAMLINGILFNSEAWHGVTRKDVKELERLDEALLRGMVKAHSKTPTEFLYLELGALPLRWVIAQRRINYLKHIIDRSDNELIKKVYNAQKNNPTKGDFAKLVQKDLENIGMKEEEFVRITRTTVKKEVKTDIKDAAFKELLKMKSDKKKIKEIEYKNLELQNYLKNDSDLTRKESNAIFSIRSQCVKGIRSNFGKMFKSNKCPLNCENDQTPVDTQEHIFKCKELEHTHGEFSLDNLNMNSPERKASIREFLRLKLMREKRLEPAEPSSLPGAILDQSTPRGAPAVHSV
jgi:hypothetical protein